MTTGINSKSPPTMNHLSYTLVSFYRYYRPYTHLLQKSEYFSEMLFYTTVSLITVLNSKDSTVCE